MKSLDVIDQKSPRGDVIKAIVQDGSVWFSQKSVASLFGITRAGVCQNAREAIKRCGAHEKRDIILEQIEGGRIIKRSVSHVSIRVVHAIAVSCGYWDERAWLIDVANSAGIAQADFRVFLSKERDFEEILFGALNGICEACRQFRIGKYAVDFYIPMINTAVEFDEVHHQKAGSVVADAERELAIMGIMDGISFIRVCEGQEIEGLNLILKKIFENAYKLGKP